MEFCDFAVVFGGVLGKEGVSLWCFGGEFVVECVAEMDARQRIFSPTKNTPRSSTLFLFCSYDR
jgi:hypothetical protein